MTDGFGAGFNGPLVLAAEFPKGADTTSLERLAAALRDTPDVVAVTPPTSIPHETRPLSASSRGAHRNRSAPPTS